MKKLAKVLLSFMLVVVCSFSLTSCFFDFDDDEEIIYGTYYFNDIVKVDEGNEEYEQMYYGSMLGTTILVEENKFTMSISAGGEEHEMIFDLEKESEKYKLTMTNPDNENEKVVYYAEISNGVVEVSMDGATAQFVKDKTKVVQKFEYINVDHDIESKNEGQGGQLGGAVGSVALAWVSYSFINLDGNILILYVNGKEFRYNLTKNGSVYDLTLVTSFVTNLLHDGTVKILEDSLEIVYEDTDFKTTINYISVESYLSAGNGTGEGTGSGSVQDTIYGTYYFNDIVEISEGGTEYEQVYYGVMFGTSIVFEENKFTIIVKDGDENLTIDFDVVKEGNGYKMTADDPSGGNEQMVYYCEFLNGEANITMEEEGVTITSQYLKDQSKIVKKYEYKCEGYTLGSGNNNQGSSGNVGQVGLAWMPQYSYININNNTLSLFVLGKEIKYTMTKNGGVYNLTLITSNVDNLFHNGTVDVLADGLEVHYLYNDSETTFNYSKINY